MKLDVGHIVGEFPQKNPHNKLQGPSFPFQWFSLSLTLAPPIRKSSAICSLTYSTNSLHVTLICSRSTPFSLFSCSISFLMIASCFFWLPPAISVPLLL